MASNWYDRTIVPQIIRFGCGGAMVTEHRQAIVPRARGRVLELGLGAGANLRFYDPAAIERIVGIEPSAELRAMAAKADRPAGMTVDIVDAAGEALPFADASFDDVLCTFTLCSVADPARTLAEARRVLKPGGRFLFCEHGLAPDAGVARWQQRVNPVWKKLFGGCHITRPVSASIERQFTMRDCHGGYQEKAPRIAGWIERGEAVAA